MPISAADQAERIRKAQQLLSETGTDRLLLTAPDNIYYLSGFRTTLYTRLSAVVVSKDGPPVLVIPSIERCLATGSWFSPTWYQQPNQVRAYGPLEPHKSHLELLAAIIPAESIVGVDALSFADSLALAAVIPGIQCVPAGQQVNALRTIKSEAELSCIRQACAIALSALKDLVEFVGEAVKEGADITELDIAMRLESCARREGAEGFGYPTLVSFGHKMQAPHSPPLRRVIERGKTVRIAFGPVYEGYVADVVRTLVIGEPSADILALETAYMAGYQACLGGLRAGGGIADAVLATSETYQSLGVLDQWDGGIGHGCGISIHEPPRIQVGSQGAFAEGMVVAIEPDLSRDDIGYSHCDLVRVTQSGYEVLSPGLCGLLVVR